MSNYSDEEWLMKNFKAIKQAIEIGVVENSARQDEITSLRESVTMLIRENQVLRQRINILQSGQVLGATSDNNS